jgi:hypothetical protein
MHLGDELFNSLDSPFRSVKKVAACTLIFSAIAMPITFRHLLMDYVNVETAKIQVQLNHVEQQVMQQVMHPHWAVHSDRPTPDASCA